MSASRSVMSFLSCKKLVDMAQYPRASATFKETARPSDLAMETLVGDGRRSLIPGNRCRPARCCRPWRRSPTDRDAGLETVRVYALWRSGAARATGVPSDPALSSRLTGRILSRSTRRLRAGPLGMCERGCSGRMRIAKAKRLKSTKGARPRSTPTRCAAGEDGHAADGDRQGLPRCRGVGVSGAGVSRRPWRLELQQETSSTVRWRRSVQRFLAGLALAPAGTGARRSWSMCHVGGLRHFLRYRVIARRERHSNHCPVRSIRKESNGGGW